MCLDTQINPSYTWDVALVPQLYAPKGWSLFRGIIMHPHSLGTGKYITWVKLSYVLNCLPNVKVDTRSNTFNHLVETLVVRTNSRSFTRLSLSAMTSDRLCDLQSSLPAKWISGNERIHVVTAGVPSNRDAEYKELFRLVFVDTCKKRLGSRLGS